MKLIAVALVILALAIGALAAVLALRDSESGQSPEPDEASEIATRLAEQQGVSPAVMEERLRIAEETCDVLREVGAGGVASVCRFNVVEGDPWWEGMPPRQLREVAEALIRAHE